MDILKSFYYCIVSIMLVILICIFLIFAILYTTSISIYEAMKPIQTKKGKKHGNKKSK